MKKIASIAALALFAVAFTSCKKEYTCECTTTTNGANPVTVSGKSEKMSKKDAEEKCNMADSETTVGANTIKVDCNIK